MKHDEQPPFSWGAGGDGGLGVVNNVRRAQAAKPTLLAQRAELSTGVLNWLVAVYGGVVLNGFFDAIIF